jgi:RNA polymerase sigma-70 factor (ECF subfamily)
VSGTSTSGDILGEGGDGPAEVEETVPTNEERFDRLYEQYFQEVLAYCLRRVVTEDGYAAANEVFEIAWRRIEDVPDDEAARAWLYTVARRVVYRYWRGVSRFRRLLRRTTVVDVPVPAPDEVVVRRAELDGVLEALALLKPPERELLRLAAWEELPHGEIAESLGCSVAAVDQRLHRAKRKLAAEYDRVMHTPRLASRNRAIGGRGS